MSTRHMPHFQRLLWIGGGLVAVMAVLLGIDRLALHHLREDADQSARQWALQLTRTVPDLPRVLRGEPPSPEARAALSALHGSSGLFRFRLFDPQGRLVLVSETPGTLPATTLRPHAVPAAALAGGTAVTLKQGNGLTLPEIYSEAYAPVLQQERTIGVIEVYLDQTARAALTTASFREAALLAAGALAASFALGAAVWYRRMGIERQAHARLQYLVQHDTLTGALNMAGFRQLLEASCRQGPEAGRGLAVLAVDIDDFRAINDRHGQVAGDRLLSRTADRLRQVLRGADALARLSADRFAVLQTGVRNSEDVKALAERLLAALSEPCEVGTGEVQVTACIGAAILGVDGRDGEALTQHAEQALLRARAQGRGSYSFYDPGLDAALQRRRQLAQDLEMALAHGRLQLHYQPLYRSDDGTLQGYEALARWHHPEKGPISPAEFIPLAESMGLIVTLGRWVLRTACHQAASWPGELSVAVNLSAAQFGEPEALVNEVKQALTDAGLPPRRLELEITESLLMNHTEQVMHTLQALHALGLKIGMDDFGTGFSSLAYLWRFPIDKLKIDRAFTLGLDTDPKVGVIVRAIVQLSHALGIRVNAEGVETEAQREALVRHGCDELQGFLLGRPQPVGKLAHEVAEAPAVA
jgi:diguanylate cyclase (GGDEF)-like protein